MTEGLENIKFAVLKQQPDPLEWCVCTLPIPCKCGIPCLPCELPNEYYLYQSNEEYNQLGMKIMDFQEESSCFQRTICIPSLRPFTMTGKNFYNEFPIQAEKPFRCPIGKSYRPELLVHYEGTYIGKVVEPYPNTFCNGLFHELDIYNEYGQKIYNLQAKFNGTVCLFLPDNICREITYRIFDKNFIVSGEIRHMYYGFFNELCSKADQYGITFPDEADYKQKYLITMASLMVDYLWFENS